MIEFIPQLPETRITNFVRIQRERSLPIPGEVSGAIGMRIGAQDVIARAYPPKMRRALSLTRVIGVREADVPKRLLKQVGDPVEAREIIIAKPINLGVQRLVYRAPEAGQVAAIQGSWMILDLYGPPYDVPALYRGTIISVAPRRGAVIEAQGALIQGAWGSGKETVGVIKWLTKDAVARGETTARAARGSASARAQSVGSEVEPTGAVRRISREDMVAPDAIVDANALEADARGSILIVGGGVTEAFLLRAEELQAAGIVAGSLAPELRTLAGAIRVPVLITEGFGQLTMSAPVFELLSALHGQEAALNARYQLRGREATRPELFVPLVVSRMQQSDQTTEAKRPEIAPGARVRGTCAPYLGRVGTLPQDFALKWVRTDAGTQLPGIEVEWQESYGERDTVPWTNLELIG